MKEEFIISNLSELQVGDIIRHRSGGKSLIVTGNYGSHVTAVVSQDITNPTEWIKIEKSLSVKSDEGQKS